MSWVADSELPGYEQFTIELPEEPTYALEPEGSLAATLVRRNAPTGGRALLYLHGWSDYFFQSELADRFAQQGRDFYALDLRRYGRSLRPKQLAGYIPDLSDYFVELDEAVALLHAAGHDDIVLLGHSTGGLVAALYAHARPGTFSALLLNAPWLELQASAMVRSATQPIFSAARMVVPTSVVPMGDNGFYHRSISAKEQGEWSYNQNLKGDPAFLVRVGWLAAIMAGHRQVMAGLDIAEPILVVLSKRSDFRRVWDDVLMSADTVLDVENIAERVHRLGDRVVLERYEGALHDLLLSRPEVREAVYASFGRFLDGYVGQGPVRL